MAWRRAPTWRISNWFREQVNGLFAPPDASAGDRLQVMTIHKAKGLEFDTVILPGLGEVTRPDDQSLLLCVEQGGETLLAPIGESGGEDDPMYRYLMSIERRKSDQETARLLYVAATRARHNLHLLGLIRRKNDGTLAEPKSDSFLKLLWPAVGRAIRKSHAAPERPEKPLASGPSAVYRPAGAFRLLRWQWFGIARRWSENARERRF